MHIKVKMQVEEDKPTYQLALCEIHHPLLHGPLEEDKNINNHFLIYTTYNSREFYDNSYKPEEDSFQRYRLRQNNAMRLNETHPSLRKYTQKYCRLEIVQYHILNVNGSRYHIAFLKTFWLRIVQRCWKKVYKARQDLIKNRTSIKVLQEKQRTGVWPMHLRTWPAFKLNLAN
jgi:hypothetical protein